MHQVVFEAKPFCYGPASIAVAIARALRTRLDGADCRLVGLGDDTSYDLFASSRTFDDCVAFDHPPDDARPEVRSLVSDADLVVSVGDPEFVEAAAELDTNCFGVDPVYWFASEDAPPLDACERYYATYFPGIGDSLVGSATDPDEDADPVVVNPIQDTHTLSTVADRDLAEEDGFVLVNFGGMDSPLGANTDLALAMAEEIAAVVERSDTANRVRFNGGGDAIDRIADALDDAGPAVHVQTEPRSPEAWLEDVARCDVLLTAPGMSMVFEAQYLRKETLLLLPMNYSQHLQERVFRDVLTGVGVTSWDDVPGYETLPFGLAEERGVERCLAQGREFGRDPDARASFAAAIDAFLSEPRSGGLRVGTDEAGDPLLSFDGASQIAADAAAFLDG